MNARKVFTAIATSTCSVLLLVSARTAEAQSRIDPGFNLFTVAQDQEIGRQSADEVERELPILRDRSIDAYVSEVGRRLAVVAPGANFDYQFKVVNVSDINAFALPGGFLYLNRGLIEAAENEGQLAGVMAHEMAHVALRHGTNQASKAYVSQTGLGLLAGLIGKDDHSTDDMIAAAGGFGLNAVFLKFSRGAEENADITGARMMAEAGYDPADMVDFFAILAATQDHDPGKVEQFFSSHPAPADRSARINDEIALLNVQVVRPVGGFASVHSELSRMRPAQSMQQLAAGQSAPSRPPLSDRSGRTVPEARIDAPSADFRVFSQRDGLFRIDYPENWRVYEADRGYGVTLAPANGYVDTGGQQGELVSGVIVNNYDPFENDSFDRFSNGDGLIEGSSALIRASNDLIDQVLQINPDLRLVRNSERRDRIDGSPSLSVVLSGLSPVTREEERITVFTRGSPDDQIIYALFVAPQQDYARLNQAFNRMISSLRVSDQETNSAEADRVSASPRSDDRGEAIPSGTMLRVRFDETLSSASSRVGDRFTAQVVEPVRLNGRIAIPVGSTISGRVTDVQSSKRFGGRAQMNLEFSSLRLPSGSESPISASFHGQAESQTKKDTVTIGGAAAGGAVVGRVLGDDSEDTVLGALVGGAIGTAIAARSRGEEVELPEGVTVEIHLDAPVAL